MPQGASKLAVWTVGILAAFADAQPTQALRNVKVGDQVPAFSVTDLTGNAIDKTTYKDRPLLLVFVRPEHEKSLGAMRVTQRIFRDYAETKLAVLAISTKPKAGDYFKRIVSTNGFRFPVGLDPERKVYGDFGLIVSPTTLLIDGEGVLRFELPHVPPNYEQTLRIHADFLLGKTDGKEHETQLAKMKEGPTKTPRSTDRRLGLAKSLLKRRRFDQAISILTKLRAESDSPQAAILLGTAYIDLDKIEEAGRCLDGLADQSQKPAPAGLHLALGRLESRRGHDGEAERHLLKALERSPDKARILYELGLLSERGGKQDEARDFYRRSLEDVFKRGG